MMTLSERILAWVLDNLMPWVALGLIGFIVLGFLILSAALLDEAEADLRKDKWECSVSHAEQSTSYIQVGKVLVPNTTTLTVCDRWSSRK